MEKLSQKPPDAYRVLEPTTPRLLLPPEDVQTDLLRQRSRQRSFCEFEAGK